MYLRQDKYLAWWVLHGKEQLNLCHIICMCLYYMCFLRSAASVVHVQLLSAKNSSPLLHNRNLDPHFQTYDGHLCIPTCRDLHLSLLKCICLAKDCAEYQHSSRMSRHWWSLWWSKQPAFCETTTNDIAPIQIFVKSYLIYPSMLTVNFITYFYPPACSSSGSLSSHASQLEILVKPKYMTLQKLIETNRQHLIITNAW